MFDPYTSLIHQLAVDEPNSGYTAEKITLRSEDLATVVENEPDMLCNLLNRWDIESFAMQAVQALRAGDDAELGRLLRSEIHTACRKRILTDVRILCARWSDARTTQREIERRRADAASIPSEGPL